MARTGTPQKLLSKLQILADANGGTGDWVGNPDSPSGTALDMQEYESVVFCILGDVQTPIVTAGTDEDATEAYVVYTGTGLDSGGVTGTLYIEVLASQLSDPATGAEYRYVGLSYTGTAVAVVAIRGLARHEKENLTVAFDGS